VPAVLAGKVDTLPKNVRDTTRVPLGNYRGLRFGIVLHSQFPPDVYLEGAITRQSGLSREHQGPRAVLNALERLAGGYDSECDRMRRDLGIAESQLRDYHARLGKPFPHESYLSQLTELRDSLKTELSAHAHESGEDRGPAASELAERIKALKAANTIETTPQRVQRKQAAAGEEPITARVRRRQEANAVSTQAMVTEVTAEAGPVSTRHSSGKPTMTFQERIALERQPKDSEPSLS
jgi:hypothetical protein